MRDEDRLGAHLPADAAEADGVGEGRGGLARGGLVARGEREEPPLVAARLNFGQEHVEARPRPIAREAAGRHVGGAADRIEEARVTGEKRADSGARDVRIGLSEGAVGGGQVRGGGKRGGRLGVEDGGILGVGDGRR